MLLIAMPNQLPEPKPGRMSVCFPGIAGRAWLGYFVSRIECHDSLPRYATASAQFVVPSISKELRMPAAFRAGQYFDCRSRFGLSFHLSFHLHRFYVSHKLSA
jgi:hypothetical protein